MPQLDPVLSAIADGLSTGGLSHPTAKAVHHIAHLLLAARTLDDVSVFAFPSLGGNGRYSVPVAGKWGVTFVMSNSGPDDLRLEKLSKSCPANLSRSSRLRRPEKS